MVTTIPPGSQRAFALQVKSPTLTTAKKTCQELNVQHCWTSSAGNRPGWLASQPSHNMQSLVKSQLHFTAACCRCCSASAARQHIKGQAGLYQNHPTWLATCDCICSTCAACATLQHCSTEAGRKPGWLQPSHMARNVVVQWLRVQSCICSTAALYCSRLQAAPTLQPSHMACIMQWLCMQVQSQNSTLTTAKKPS